MTQDTEAVAQPVANIDKLVEIYIKIRDARESKKEIPSVKSEEL